MPELTPSLDVAIAEEQTLTADASAAVADTTSITAEASAAVAETAIAEAGLQVRVVTETTHLVGLDAQIEDEWERAAALAKRDAPCVIHLGIGKSIKALLLQKTGAPKTFTWHREDGQLVACTEPDCPQCDAKLPRRTITVLNIYEFEEKAVRLLVCDELLTTATYAAIVNRDVEKSPLAFHSRLPTEYPTTREFVYEVKIMPELPPDEWEAIAALDPIEVTTIADEVLVGGLF